MKTKRASKTGLQMLNALAPQKRNSFFMKPNRSAMNSPMAASSSLPTQGKMSLFHAANARKGKKARKHRAVKGGMGNNFMMAPEKSGMRAPDLGGTGPQEIAKTGLGQGGGFQGDWPYNKFAKKGKKARKHMASKPKGAHGRAAVRALGRTKTTGNFKKIEKAKGKGAAIGAYQNALAKHEGRTAPYGGKKAKKFAHKGHSHKSRKAMKNC